MIKKEKYIKTRRDEMVSTYKQPSETSRKKEIKKEKKFLKVI